MDTTPILPQPIIETDIRFVRETRDYDCFLVIDGQREYIGSRTRRDDAEAFCNVERLRLLDHIPFIPTAYDLLPEEADDLAPVLADLHADVTTPDAAPIDWDTHTDAIATLDDGRIIYGTYDTDATPLFVRYDGPEGDVWAEEDGSIGGMWGGCHLDMTAEQVDALYTLFQTGLLKQMQTIGALWLKDAPTSPRLTCRYQPDPHLLHTITPCGPLAAMLDGPPTTPLAPAAVPTTPLHDPAEGEMQGPIGIIDGMPVVATYVAGELMIATVQTPYGPLATDGVRFLQTFGDTTGGCAGDVDVTIWDQLMELEQGGVIRALLALARQHRTGPPRAETVRNSTPDGAGGESPIIPFADLQSDGEGACRTTLGRIAGMDVRAIYGGSTDLLEVSILTPHGRISTDGTTYLNLPTPDEGCIGDVSLAAWGYIYDLTQAGHLDALMALARQYPALPPVEGPEPFVPLADMEPGESGLRRGTLGYVGFVPMIAEYDDTGALVQAVLYWDGICLLVQYAAVCADYVLFVRTSATRLYCFSDADLLPGATTVLPFMQRALQRAHHLGVLDTFLQCARTYQHAAASTTVRAA